MSVIIAIKFKDGIVIGADKQSTRGNEKYDEAVKIHKSKYSETCIGTVGYTRDSDIINTIDEIINYKDILDNINIDKNYVVQNIVPFIFDKLRDNKRLLLDNGIEKSLSEFVFCTNKDIFIIRTDGAVLNYKDYCAIGCGEQFAKGYLNTFKNISDINQKDVLKILEESIKESCKNDIYINNNIDIIILK